MELFQMEIQLGNAAMSDREEIAGALTDVAARLVLGEDDGTVTDDNGNTVGRWQLT